MLRDKGRGLAHLQNKSFMAWPEIDHLQRQQVLLIKLGARKSQEAVFHITARELTLGRKMKCYPKSHFQEK